MKKTVFLLAMVCVATAACAPKNTKIYAQEKEYIPPSNAAPWKIGGVFDEKELSVIVTINGENVIRGRFPPYTPRLTAEGKYNDLSVATVCMFSQGIIAGKGGGGFQQRIAEAIVAKTTKTGGNSCEVRVEDKVATTLYF